MTQTEGVTKRDEQRGLLGGLDAGDARGRKNISFRNLVRRDQGEGLGLQFDLAELRGYGYHTGVVFAAYIPAYGRAVARGGRYDGIGAAFGRSRPATGFDADLKLLAALPTDQAQTAVITAPAPPADAIQASALVRKVDELRAQGRRVAWTLAPAADTAAPDPEHPALVWRDLQWTVMPPAFKGTDSHG